MHHCHHHGYGAKYCHTRHGYKTDYCEALDASIGAGCHADACHSHKYVFHQFITAEELGCHRNGKHSKTYAKPAHLGERNHGTGQITAVAAEAANRQIVERQSAIAAHIAQGASVGSKQGAAKQQCAQELPEIEPFSQLLPHPHTRREEGEAHHYHKHFQEPTARFLRHLLVGVVDIHFRCFVAHNLSELFCSIQYFSITLSIIYTYLPKARRICCKRSSHSAFRSSDADFAKNVCSASYWRFNSTFFRFW